MILRAGAWGDRDRFWVEEARKNVFWKRIIATSHDLTPNGGLVREISLFQGNLKHSLIYFNGECREIEHTLECLGM